LDLSGWDIAVIFAKAITYGATLCGAGSVFFLAYSGSLLRSAQAQQIRRMIGALLLVAAIASSTTILLLAGSMSGDVAGMFDSTFAGMILHAGQGRATGIRLAGLALCAFAIAVNRRLTLPALIGAIVAASSFAWIGHIHALQSNTLPSLFLCVHLLCAAFWLGAFAPLLVVVQGGELPQIAQVAARFGKTALATVAMLLLAGASLLFMLIQHAAEFWNSGYGRLVAVKLLAVGALLSVAALNKLHLTPRLSGGDFQAVRALRRSIRIEMLLGALILLITAAFTTLTGPPQ
jgi:copper resistance protein D